MNESELLFTETLNCNRASLLLNRDSPLDKDKSAFIASVLKRRIRAEPIQYILGKTEFMGLEFKVNKNVFIPRPETEILVETAIDYAYRLLPGAYRNYILELGTGSGCIAISLAKYLSGFNITATDISREALNIAGENARFNSVENKIVFLKSNLFESLAVCGMRYAVCVCNPPYIPTEEIKDLQPEIRYEPAISLDGGRDGLDFYRKVVANAAVYLNKRGFLIMEIGFKQKDGIKNIFQKSGDFEIIEVVKDYNNIDRVIVSRLLN